MSVLYESNRCFLISHQLYIDSIYKNVSHEGYSASYSLKESFFDVSSPFLRDGQAQSRVHGGKKKKKRVCHLLTTLKDLSETAYCKRILEELLTNARDRGYFLGSPTKDEILMNNRNARESARAVYDHIKQGFGVFTGENVNNHSLLYRQHTDSFLIPPKCRFICNKIEKITEYLTGAAFHLIVLDPPWWNKFIRRKRKADLSYSMLDNSDLIHIPIENLLVDGGIAVVWTTNSKIHIDAVLKSFFPKWGITYVATWYWIKVTRFGEPICEFNPGGKQPYERIIIGQKGGSNNKFEEGKCIVSVPSAIHSHKPPLGEIFGRYVPKDAKCLELFARYLLPGWTSFGDQLLCLQNATLYDVK